MLMHWLCWDPPRVLWLWTVTSPGVLRSDRTSLCASERLTVFFISCVCLPHKAFETVRRSIWESNAQKEKVAAAAAPVESGHSLSLSQPASLWGRDYTLNPGLSRQKDEKDYLFPGDTAGRREWRGLSWQEPTGFRRTKHACQSHEEVCFGGVFLILDSTWQT